MTTFFEKLKTYIEQHPLDFTDGETILGMVYECYNENHPYDNEQIKADFNELYRQMNGMTLQDMDRIIYTVCALCRDHERAGFIEGIKIGLQLQQEISNSY